MDGHSGDLIGQGQGVLASQQDGSLARLQVYRFTGLIARRIIGQVQLESRGAQDDQEH